MNSILFKAGGALTDEHALIYVERKADREALTHLRAMDYLLVIEPRQQGKTSLINHLMCHPALGNVAFAYVDVTTPDRKTETTWYQTLCPRILRQLRSFIPQDQWPTIPQNSAGWRGFLRDVAALAADAQLRVVIALDEIGAVTFPGATEFFSVLRDVYNSRQAEAELKQLTFLLAGAFHPRDLIKDDKISPFNIAQRVRLADFTLAQVQELAGKGGWPPGQATALAERIHYWTDGQPYLTQLLCTYLGPDATPSDVDASIERLRREDENHLPPLLERLHSDEKLHGYAGRILAGERIKFYPRENRRQAQLELLGVIKADAEGYCIIRNRIYLQALGWPDKVFTPESEDDMTSPRRIRSSIAIPQELSQQMSKGNVVLFVGAGLSIGAGLPDWDTLIRPLAERIGYKGDDQLKAAQFYENRYGRHALISYLRDKLDTTGIEPTENHDLLARLPIDTVFTTNFDDLLERAYRRAGRPVNLVVGATELPFWDESRINLVKLHGTYDRPDSFIITERDYNTIYRRNALIVQQLNTLLATKTFLFIGYSVSDPDFNQIYDQLSIDLGRHQRRPYLVTFDVDEFTMEDLERRGFHVVSLPGEGGRNARLAEWLRALLDAVAEPASEAVTAPPSAPPCPQPGPTVPQPSKPAYGRGSMNLDRGLKALRTCLANADEEIKAELATLEDRLTTNRRNERLFGSSENTRNERAQIIFSLNELALKHCGVSFNELCQGAEPTLAGRPHPPEEIKPRTTSPRRERDRVRFKLQIARLTGVEFEVRALETPMGEPHATGRLPYDRADLIAVLKVLELGHYHPDRFTSAQTEALQRLGLLRDARLVPDLLPRLGKGLYDALFTDDIGVAFRMAFNQARSRHDTVFLQLRFDQDAVELARYPWELLHDGHRHLLSGGAVEMTRYVTYGEAATALPAEPPWRLLFISARPRNLTPLPAESERLAVWNGLQSLAETGKLTLELLDSPTYDALLDRMASADYHIIHFDGHGVFARRCPQCGTMHYPHVTSCQSCVTPLDDVPPLGYLAFEDRSGNADYVSTVDMENLLVTSEVRLVVLSACQGSIVRDESLFGGLGPGLIRAGVPAVVAMQFSVPVKAAISFAEGFYGALARGETVSRAVAQGRRKLFRGKTWFIPTLYLRSQDDEGHLFIEEH